MASWDNIDSNAHLASIAEHTTMDTSGLPSACVVFITNVSFRIIRFLLLLFIPLFHFLRIFVFLGGFLGCGFGLRSSSVGLGRLCGGADSCTISVRDLTP
jgi:hypothetical protein